MLEGWERGKVRPTLEQLEAFAKATRVSVEFFFLAESPVECVPISDFRTAVTHEAPSASIRKSRSLTSKLASS